MSKRIVVKMVERIEFEKEFELEDFAEFVGLSIAEIEQRAGYDLSDAIELSSEILDRLYADGGDGSTYIEYEFTESD